MINIEVSPREFMRVGANLAGTTFGAFSFGRIDFNLSDVDRATNRGPLNGRCMTTSLITRQLLKHCFLSTSLCHAGTNSAAKEVIEHAISRRRSCSEYAKFCPQLPW